MRDSLLIALGGAVGSVIRFRLSEWMLARFGGDFPLGTLLVNVTGSFLIGFLANWPKAGGMDAVNNTVDNPGYPVSNVGFFSGNAHLLFGHPSTRMLLVTGLCGGYTTFSTFSLQTLELAHKGAWLHAGANAIGSVVACLVAVWLGYTLAGWVRARGGG